MPPPNFFKVGGIKKNQGEEGVQWGTGDVSERTKTNVSDGTSTLQGKHVHLCQIILKSMHKSKNYGLDYDILSFDFHV